MKENDLMKILKRLIRLSDLNGLKNSCSRCNQFIDASVVNVGRRKDKMSTKILIKKYIEFNERIHGENDKRTIILNCYLY